jgi:sulfite exporter TauE/SafE
MDSALPLLGFGFVLGLKHVTEADHLVAVSTIVSEHRSIWRPVAVGAVHGLAGSAALTLFVLGEEVLRGGSKLVGFAYLLVFGVGSIGGMLLMSTIIGLPFVLTARRFRSVDTPVRLLAGTASVLFGLYYAWQTTAGAR